MIRTMTMIYLKRASIFTVLIITSGNYKRPSDSDILEFGEENYFLSNFLKSPWTPSNDNKAIFGFSGTMLSTPKQHRKNRKKKQALDGLYWSVFYMH